MATIKSHTDLQQSKKLAEILPLESADMYYLAKPDDTNSNMVASDICIPRRSENDGQAFGEACAWSLAALLGILPEPYQLTSNKEGKVQLMLIHHLEKDYYDNPIDACVAMIIKLHDNKLL